MHSIPKQGINPAEDVFWLTKNLKSCRRTGLKLKRWISMMFIVLKYYSYRYIIRNAKMDFSQDDMEFSEKKSTVFQKIPLKSAD